MVRDLRSSLYSYTQTLILRAIVVGCSKSQGLPQQISYTHIEQKYLNNHPAYYFQPSSLLLIFWLVEVLLEIFTHFGGPHFYLYGLQVLSFFISDTFRFEIILSSWWAGALLYNLVQSQQSFWPYNFGADIGIAIPAFFEQYLPGTSVQFSSVAQSCPTLCDSMNRSMPGLPVHHQLPEFTQTHVHRVSDAKAETSVFWPPHAKLTHWKRL